MAQARGVAARGTCGSDHDKVRAALWRRWRGISGDAPSGCERRGCGGQYRMETESRRRCEDHARAECGGVEGDPGVRYQGVLDELTDRVIEKQKQLYRGSTQIVADKSYAKAETMAAE